ncbi:hypothetical protein ACWCW7_27205 [Nocardia tengchongensis]
MTEQYATENRYTPAAFPTLTTDTPVLHDVAGPAPIMPKMPDPHLPEKIEQKTNPAPASPAPVAPQPDPRPQPAAPAPVTGQNPSSTGDPNTTLAQLGLRATGQPAPPAPGGVEDLTAVLAAGKPSPGQTLTLPSGNTTITTGANNTTIIGTTDPTTGHNKTDILDQNGLVIATAESDIVLGTGGLSRDTTITSIGGAVTQVRSVDDGYGYITTWTANPDGSHSVRYADGTVVKEHAPGSNTPDEVVQLDPDGLSGHVTEYNRDGTTNEADFHPGVLGAPVTDITKPDGSKIQVATVPGHTNGAPYSIITNPDHTRVVLQPDGTTVPIDRYNDMIGGPNYGNQFDPLTGTWRSDPVTARGPILTAPDGTSTQDWTFRNRQGEQRTATATFDKNGNLTALQSGDYTGFDSSAFKTVDGITVPTWSGHADAGNVKDDTRLYWDAILSVSGLPEIGYRAGLAIGTRLIARELAAKGVSEAGIQLATSQLVTRGGTSFTGIVGAARDAASTTPQFGAGASSRWWQFATRYRSATLAPERDAMLSAQGGARHNATQFQSTVESILSRATVPGLPDGIVSRINQISEAVQIRLGQIFRRPSGQNHLGSAATKAASENSNVISNARKWIEERPDKFDLKYSKPELDEIINESRQLGLSAREIHDLITAGSRIAKPITFPGLKEQITNWATIVKPRGFPYKFGDAQEFRQFSIELRSALETRGAPAEDVVIQGSSLRKPSAADIDIAVFVDRDRFDRILVDRFDGRIATRPGPNKPAEPISLAGLSHDQLTELARNIMSDQSVYNGQAKTFGNAMTNGTISSKSDILKPLKDARKEISMKYPDKNIEAISIQMRDGAFDTRPNLPIN